MKTDKKTADMLNSIYDRLDDNSKDVYDMFLGTYNKNSATQFRTAILNMIHDVIKKYKFNRFTVEDYRNVIKYYKTDLNENKTQDSYRDSFFKFLFALEIMDDEYGFTDYFTREQCIKQFEKKAKKDNVDIKNNCLSFLETMRLEQFVNESFESDEDKLKMSFVAHMLYNEDVDISKLKNAKLKDYNFKTKELHINNVNYHILDKHIQLFEKVLSKKLVHNGMNFINDSITRLGEILDIPSLTPQKIRNTKNSNTLICPNCKKVYTNTQNNWTSVNGKIICYSCFEELKKNDKTLEDNNISINEIEMTNLIDNERISNLLYSFDNLHKNLLKSLLNENIDFEKINKLKKYIGDLGETFVYEYEKNILKDTKYYDLVDNMPSKNPSLGYDILSYKPNGDKKYIEVKTEAFDKDNDFFISDNELSVGKKIIASGNEYCIYRVHNIFKSKNEICFDIISLSEILNDSNFTIIPYNYKVSKN